MTATTTMKKRKPKHGGLRPGAGRKAQPTRCLRCGKMCRGARIARVHCSGKAAR